MLTAAYENQSGTFTRERVLTAVLALFTALAIYVCYRIARPFIPAMAFALALAVATRRPYRWINSRLNRNRSLSAAIAVVLVALLIIGPAASLITYIVQMAVEGIGELQSTGGIASIESKLENTPYIGAIVQRFTNRFQIEEQLGALGSMLASRASGILSGSIGVITQLGITLFVLFFFYRDSKQALAAVRTLVPLSERESDRMFNRVGNTIYATVNGSFTVAFVQACVAGIVYAILGVPAAILWAAVTFFTALIPVFGTFIVWAPIAAYLAISGHIVKAIFLLAWGSIVVSSVDNILYPYLVGDKLRLHTVPTFFSIVGGISLFGPVGLILGPISLAITIALIDIWWQRTENGQPAEQAISANPESPPPGEILHEHES